jgi:hypothetical protein
MCLKQISNRMRLDLCGMPSVSFSCRGEGIARAASTRRVRLRRGAGGGPLHPTRRAPLSLSPSLRPTSTLACPSHSSPSPQRLHLLHSCSALSALHLSSSRAVLRRATPAPGTPTLAATLRRRLGPRRNLCTSHAGRLLSCSHTRCLCCAPAASRFARRTCVPLLRLSSAPAPPTPSLLPRRFSLHAPLLAPSPQGTCRCISRRACPSASLLSPRIAAPYTPQLPPCRSGNDWPSSARATGASRACPALHLAAVMLTTVCRGSAIARIAGR